MLPKAFIYQYFSDSLNISLLALICTLVFTIKEFAFWLTLKKQTLKQKLKQKLSQQNNFENLVVLEQTSWFHLLG